MEFFNLASGSKGNCSIVTSGKTTVMIDDGISLAELNKRIKDSQMLIQNIDAIVITHEHGDHIRGVEKLSTTCDIPVYIHTLSLNKMSQTLSKYKECNMEKPLCIKDLEITPFRLPHDSAYNLGYCISNGKQIMTMATDMGCITDLAKSYMLKSDFVYIEANHDIEMLKKGNYSYSLKQRILSDNGHLSNDECGKLVAELANAGCQKFMLAHLSQDNNAPEIAFNCVNLCLENNKIKEGKDVFVDVASQIKASKMIRI